MASLSNIVQVAIVIGTQAITSTSFSTMMILREAAPAGTPRAIIVVSTADLVSQTGVTTTDPLYLAVADAFGQSPAVNQIMVGAALATDATIAASLDAVNAAAAGLGGFYGFILAGRDIPSVKACMDWAQANTKLFGYATAEADALDPTKTDDLLSYGKTQNYQRSFGFYHANALTDFPDAACMSKGFVILPGGENYANQLLLGITTDALTGGGHAAVIGKNGNTFESVGNLSITFNGMCGSGERIDVVRFVDWLQNEIQVDVATLLVSTGRIAYTEKGISAIKSAVVQALDQGISQGGISPNEVNAAGTVVPSYQVSTPTRSSIPAADVASRQLNGVTFIAQLAGAINSTAIAGTVTYGNLS